MPATTAAAVTATAVTTVPATAAPAAAALVTAAPATAEPTIVAATPAAATPAASTTATATAAAAATTAMPATTAAAVTAAAVTTVPATAVPATGAPATGAPATVAPVAAEPITAAVTPAAATPAASTTATTTAAAAATTAAPASTVAPVVSTSAAVTTAAATSTPMPAAATIPTSGPTSVPTAVPTVPAPSIASTSVAPAASAENNTSPTTAAKGNATKTNTTEPTSVEPSAAGNATTGNATKRQTTNENATIVQNATGPTSAEPSAAGNATTRNATTGKTAAGNTTSTTTQNATESALPEPSAVGNATIGNAAAGKTATENTTATAQNITEAEAAAGNSTTEVKTTAGNIATAATMAGPTTTAAPTLAGNTTTSTAAPKIAAADPTTTTSKPPTASSTAIPNANNTYGAIQSRRSEAKHTTSDNKELAARLFERIEKMGILATIEVDPTDIYLPAAPIEETENQRTRRLSKFRLGPAMEKFPAKPPLPRGARVFVPMVEKSMEGFNKVAKACKELTKVGLDAVPHIPASRFDTVEEAVETIDMLEGADKGARALIVGGNDQKAREQTNIPFATAGDLLDSGILEKAGFEKILLAAYPEGLISPAGNHTYEPGFEKTREILMAKAETALRAGMQVGIVTQLSFNPRMLISWLDKTRKELGELSHQIWRELRAKNETDSDGPKPIVFYIGIQGPRPVSSLTRISKRIGVPTKFAGGMFNQVDTDHDGTVNVEELAQALKDGVFSDVKASSLPGLFRRHSHHTRNGTKQVLNQIDFAEMVVNMALVSPDTAPATDASPGSLSRFAAVRRRLRAEPSVGINVKGDSKHVSEADSVPRDMVLSLAVYMEEKNIESGLIRLHVYPFRNNLENSLNMIETMGQPVVMESGKDGSKKQEPFLGSMDFARMEKAGYD